MAPRRSALRLLAGGLVASHGLGAVGQTAPAASASATAPRFAAQRVAFAGSMGSRALLVIDGAAPRAVEVGSTLAGVKLVSVSGSEAVVEIDGLRHPLHLGAAALNLGGTASAGSGREISLTSDAAGHFVANGQINGRGASFLVDTGATLVAIGQPDADRLGLAYKTGRRITSGTANGTVSGWLVALDSVRLGDVDIHNVEAVVLPQPMPLVLLGNSFLTRFQLRRDNDTLNLVRRF